MMVMAGCLDSYGGRRRYAQGRSVSLQAPRSGRSRRSMSRAEEKSAKADFVPLICEQLRTIPGACQARAEDRSI